jgi:hypothetical protein
MPTMLQITPVATPETAQAETALLRAEIRRMADMVSSVVRSTAVDGAAAAMSIAGSGSRSAPHDANRVAQQLLDRAQVMQSEIERFLAIAANHAAA